MFLTTLRSDRRRAAASAKTTLHRLPGWEGLNWKKYRRTCRRWRTHLPPLHLRGMSAAGWTVHRIPRAWATRARSVPRQACQVPSCALFVNVFHCEREGVGKGVDRPVTRQFEGTLSDLTQRRLVQCRRKRVLPFCRGTESKERKGHSECKNLRREHFCGGELEPTLRTG